jgi:hypothetical protein
MWIKREVRQAKSGRLASAFRSVVVSSSASLGAGCVLSARLRADEERDITNAIRDSGKTQPEWIRETLLSAARRTRRN